MTEIPLFDGEVNVNSMQSLLESVPFKVVKISEQHLKFDGKTRSDSFAWTVVVRKGASSVLIFNTETKKILLVEQVRPAIISENSSSWLLMNPRILELLAGVLGNDTPEECARREAMEEAGIRVGRLQKISEFYLSPGMTNEKIHLFFAPIDNSNIVENAGGGLVEENEDVRSHWITLRQAKKMVFTGEIKDAKTIIGILWLLQNNKQKTKKKIK